MKEKNAKQTLEQTVSIYDAIASEFSGTRRYNWQGFLEFGRHLKPGDQVFDLGCGNGRMAEIFADKNISYLGIDNSQELIKIARERFKDQPWVRFEVGDILADSWIPDQARNDDKPGQNSGYNLVLMIAVLHHLPTQNLRLKVLKNVYNSLKPGGRLIVSNWNLWQVKSEKKQFRYWPYLFNYAEKFQRGIWSLSDALVPWKHLSGDNLRYVHSFRKAELKKMLKQVGFTVEKINFETKNGQPASIWRGDNLLAVAVKK